MHLLAQLNIAEARFAITDPRIADFVDALESVNAAAIHFATTFPPPRAMR